jgi:hypothetical protein
MTAWAVGLKKQMWLKKKCCCHAFCFNNFFTKNVIIPFLKKKHEKTDLAVPFHGCLGALEAMKKGADHRHGLDLLMCQKRPKCQKRPIQEGCRSSSRP